VGKTLLSSSTLEITISSKTDSTSTCEASVLVGQLIAKKSLDANITTVVFDRGGRIYHGRIKALADAAREEGLKF
jgi:large subunit ribosomal protein L18